MIGCDVMGALNRPEGVRRFWLVGGQKRPLSGKDGQEGVAAGVTDLQTTRDENGKRMRGCEVVMMNMRDIEANYAGSMSFFRDLSQSLC